jgi:hypothetical protein
MAPAPEPLGMTVHSLRAPQLDDAVESDDPKRRRSGRWKMLLVLLMCAAPVIASYFTYFVIRPEGRTNYSTLILPTRTMPALALRTLDGAPVTSASLRGQWLLVVVAPSTCDEACQKRLFTQRQLREMLGRERDRLDKVWLVTDAGELSPQLRVAMQAGVPTQVLRVDAVALSQWLQPEAGRDLQEHMFVVDPMGEWMMRVPANAEPARVKRDLDKLLRASSFWDTPGR